MRVPYTNGGTGALWLAALWLTLSRIDQLLC